MDWDDLPAAVQRVCAQARWLPTWVARVDVAADGGRAARQVWRARDRLAGADQRLPSAAKHEA